MKSAYELAMERLARSEPAPVTLSEEQKAALAAVDEKFRAKIAEREVFLADLMTKAAAQGNYAEVSELDTQKKRELAGLREDCEREKEKLRAEAGGG